MVDRGGRRPVVTRPGRGARRRRDAETQTIFNLDWKGQKLKETEYRRRFEEDDQSYAEMLNALISAMKASGTVDPASS